MFQNLLKIRVLRMNQKKICEDQLHPRCLKNICGEK